MYSFMILYFIIILLLVIYCLVMTIKDIIDEFNDYLKQKKLFKLIDKRD